MFGHKWTKTGASRERTRTRATNARSPVMVDEKPMLIRYFRNASRCATPLPPAFRKGAVSAR